MPTSNKYDMLQKLHDSNKTLAQCLDRVEQRSSTSTPVNQRSNTPDSTVDPQLSPRRPLHDRRQFHKFFCENRDVQQIGETDDGGGGGGQ